ncbi:MAG: hypothetical protein LBK58_11370 [Prevotellaceae bacterium]|nr:hypothetical protein [Prevotellaceae bacterium]
MKHGILNLLIAACLLTVHTSLNAQRETGSRLGITFSSLGTNDIFGGLSNQHYSLDDKSFYALGLTYIKGINRWLELDASLEYARYKMKVSANVYPDIFVFIREQEMELSMFNIPVTLRANFLKYFFVNGGLLIDLDVSSNNPYIENLTGFGGIAGFGVNYNFDFGLSVFLNPYIKAHSWINVKNQQKILEKGFRLGFAYDLHRIIKR